MTTLTQAKAARNEMMDAGIVAVNYKLTMVGESWKQVVVQTFTSVQEAINHNPSDVAVKTFFF